jgi:hypothetical protein
MFLKMSSNTVKSFVGQCKNRIKLGSGLQIGESVQRTAKSSDAPRMVWA